MQGKGLACISYFVKLSDVDNSQFDPIFNTLKDVPNPGDYKEITPFPVDNLFPEEKDRHDYYMYHGSLPYPPCVESVIWVIMENKINISHKQVTTSFMCNQTNEYRVSKTYSNITYNSSKSACMWGRYIAIHWPILGTYTIKYTSQYI